MATEGRGVVRLEKGQERGCGEDRIYGKEGGRGIMEDKAARWTRWNAGTEAVCNAATIVLCRICAKRGREEIVEKEI